MFRLLRSQDGVSVIEFAMILPVFLVVVFGIVVFGSYLAIVHGIQQLAAVAARSSISGLSEGERSALARLYVSRDAVSYPLIDVTKLTAKAASSPSDARVFVVTIIYDASEKPNSGIGVPLLPIIARTKKTVTSVNFAQALVTRLLAHPVVGASVGPLSLLLGGEAFFRPLIDGIITATTSAVDQIVASLLAVLGVGLGQADVCVTGIRCDGAVLVN